MSTNSPQLNTSTTTTSSNAVQEQQTVQTQNKSVGSTFDSDKITQSTPLQVKTIQTVVKHLSTPKFRTEDMLEMGKSLEGDSAVRAYKFQILNDQANKNIGNSQVAPNVLAVKAELESQGWQFVKSLNKDYVYIGNNFSTGELGYGLNSDGMLINFNQNESFAYFGKNS